MFSISRLHETDLCIIVKSLEIYFILPEVYVIIYTNVAKLAYIYIPEEGERRGNVRMADTCTEFERDQRAHKMTLFSSFRDHTHARAEYASFSFSPFLEQHLILLRCLTNVCACHPARCKHISCDASHSDDSCRVVTATYDMYQCLKPIVRFLPGWCRLIAVRTHTSTSTYEVL